MKKLFRLRPLFARQNKLPVYFTGVVVAESAKAYKVFGNGMSMYQAGLCSFCGRSLSNPNSIKLGIGPICAAKHGIEILSGYTHKDLEALAKEIVIDTWMPKSCVVLMQDIPGDVVVPESAIVKEEKVKTATPLKNALVLEFGYDPKLITEIKQIVGRCYESSPKPHWLIPDASYNRKIIEALGFTINERKTEPKGGSWQDDGMPLNQNL